LHLNPVFLGVKSDKQLGVGLGYNPVDAVKVAQIFEKFDVGQICQQGNHKVAKVFEF